MSDPTDKDMKDALQGLRSPLPTPDTPPVPRPKAKRGPKPKVKDPMSTRVGGDDLREGHQVAQLLGQPINPDLTSYLPGETFAEYALRLTNLNPQGSTPDPEIDPALLSIYNKEEYSEEDSSIQPIDNKGGMTDQELKFIRLYLVDHIPPQIALVAAGYKKYQDKYAYDKAQKIRKKYESCTEGREIFSDLNFGAVEIARGIIEIARTCPNAQIKLNALALCAKASGLLKEAVDQAPGVTIIIKGRDQDGDQAVGGREPRPYSPSSPSVAVAVNGPVALVR